jgi:hypothetical protein
MNPRCAAAVTEAASRLGRKVTKAELNDIESKTREMSRALATKDPMAWRSMTKADQMKQVGTALAKEFEHQAALKATRAAKDAITAAKNISYLELAVAKGLSGARSLMHKMGFIPDGKGGTVNAEYRAKALANEHLDMLRPLIDMDKDGTLLGLFSDEKGQMDVLREYNGTNTGNADAKKAAEALRKTVDSAMSRYNEVGGDIRKIQNYVPQRQDQYRVHKAGMKAWVDDAMQHIDRNTLVDLNGALLDDAKARSFLEEAWWNIAQDGLGKEKGGVSVVGANQSIANRHKQHRQLHWKSPESYMSMQKKYSAGNLIDQTKAYVERLAHETVLMEQFGSNALHQIDMLKQKAQELDKARGMDLERQGKTDKATNKLQREYAHLDNMIDKFAGINQGVTGSFLVNRFFSTIKNLNIANKLGSILTSQLADNGTALATARALNIPIKDWMNMKARGYTDDAVKRMAKSNAIAFDVMIDNLIRFGDDTDPTSFSGKLAQLTMKLSGGNFFTQMHRTAFAALVESHVGQLTRKFDWNTLPAKDKALFEGKGFTEQDWNILRAATPDAETGLLGMQQIKAIPVADIEKMLPKGTKNAAQIAESARRDAYLKVTAMALEEAEMAVLQPSLHSTTFVPLRKGEVLSELGAAALQFKSYTIAFANQHMVQRAGASSSPTMYRLGLLASTSILGGMGLMLNDLAQGKDPRDIYDPQNKGKALKFGMQAIVKGGGLSIAGDLLNVFMEEGGRPATEQLTGPFFGQVSKTLKLGQEAAQGDTNGMAKAAINLGREFIPFNNLIWTRAVWNNYLMAEINEYASPGYMGRMRGLAEKNYGQQYYLGMGTEPRLPNLAAPFNQ